MSYSFLYYLHGTASTGYSNKKIIIIVTIFTLSQDYWLQVKEIQLELAFCKKRNSTEGLNNQPMEKRGCRNMGPKEPRAARALSPPLFSAAAHYFILALSLMPPELHT